MNSINIIGNVCRDIELRKTGSGMSVTKFMVAVNRTRGNGTDFIPCTAFDTTADLMLRYVKKGDRIGVTGRVQVDSRETSDGRRTYFEVIADRVEFLDGRSQTSAQPKAQDTPVTATQLPQQLNQTQDEEDIVSEELPF